MHNVGRAYKILAYLCKLRKCQKRRAKGLQVRVPYNLVGSEINIYFTQSKIGLFISVGMTRGQGIIRVVVIVLVVATFF